MPFRPIAQACVLAALLGSVLLAQTAPKYDGIRWETDWDAAFKKAKAQNKPVMFGIMMAKERGCTTMIRDVYSDRRIIEKSREFINLPACQSDLALEAYEIDGKVVMTSPFFPGATPQQCRVIETRMHPRYLKTATVIAPQHVWVNPDGEILHRKEYWLTVDQMLGLMDRALRSHRGEKEAEAAAKDKKPDEKKADGDAAPAAELSATDERMLEHIRISPVEEKENATRQLLARGNPAGIKALVDLLLDKKEKPRKKKERAAVIRAANERGNTEAAKEFTRLLELKDAHLRNCAIVTLEEIESEAAVKALLEHYKKERKPGLKADVVRALGPCGKDDQEARKFLLEKLQSRDHRLRTAAAIALAKHLPDEEVRGALTKRYGKESSKGNTKLAILWAYMSSRNSELAPDLEKMVERERNGQMRTLAEGVADMLLGRRGNNRRGGGGRFGRGGPAGWRIYRSFTPLFAKDAIERRFIKEMRERFRGGRNGGNNGGGRNNGGRNGGNNGGGGNPTPL